MIGHQIKNVAACPEIKTGVDWKQKADPGRSVPGFISLLPRPKQRERGVPSRLRTETGPPA